MEERGEHHGGNHNPKNIGIGLLLLSSISLLGESKTKQNKLKVTFFKVKVINTQLKSKCESQIASLVSEGLRLLTQEGRKCQGPCPEQNCKNTKLWKRFNSQPRQMCHAQVRVYTVKEWSTETWNGCMWVMHLKLLKTQVPLNPFNLQKWPK